MMTYKKFILRCAMSCYDLDLTFDLAIPLPSKSCLSYMLKYWHLILVGILVEDLAVQYHVIFI